MVQTVRLASGLSEARVVQTVRLASGLSEATVVQTVRLEWLFDAASCCYLNGDGHADSFTGTALIGLHIISPQCRCSPSLTAAHWWGLLWRTGAAAPCATAIGSTSFSRGS